MVSMIRSDLDFILAQIKIAEADAAGLDIVANGMIPNPELPWGLRRVDGSNNNLVSGQENYGASDQPFPRATDPSYTTGTGGQAFGPPILNPVGHPQAGQPISIPGVNGGTTGVPLGYFPGFGGNWLANNQYAQPTPNTSADPRAIQPGDVADAAPRVISNLIVDQTANNPAVIYKALSDAGVVADPFATMGQVATAVALINTEKAAIAPLQAAVNTAQANVNAALAGITPAIQATINAYTTANTALTSLAASAAAADSATTQLLTALNTGGAVADILDTGGYANAQTMIGQLVIDAQAVVNALLSDINVAPADLAAAQNVLAAATSMQTLLGQITLANGIDFLDTGLAIGLASVADGLPASVAALDTQVDASLAAQTPPDLATAQAALVTAQANLDAGGGDVTAAENALRTLLTDSGLTLEEAPNGDILKATLFVQNVAPDEGLSAPFNGWMTIFGQFFDHGLDLVAKGGYGTVYIPLQEDDPLYVPGSSTNFMAVTRATLGPDGQPVNLVTPFVDQNQTYTSNASAQVFHREYEMRDTLVRNPAQPDENAVDAFITVQAPHATGRLLNGSAGGLATWKDIKDQALNKLGIELDDFDIHNIPQLMVDDYGNFIRGANGFPQIVISNGPPVVAVSGTPSAPVDASSAVKTGHAFLDDIAHNANPGQFDSQPGPVVTLVNEAADSDAAVSTAGQPQAPGTYDNELLDAHFITGDGRGNENIALSAVHHVFHSEHNRQIDLIKDLVLGEAKSAVVGSADAAEKLAFLNEWLATDLTAADLAAATVGNVVWDGERLFQAAKFPTEMQYQHLVFEEFARKVQPFVNVFNDYNGQLDPAILAEFAHTVYRFGHSMLTETVDRYDTNFETIGSGGVVGAEQIGLIEAFLNPIEFNAGGLSADEAAGAIARGMTRQYGNEIDEFVTEALRNNLVGLPLDLAAINIARGRETGVPSLNDARADFYAGTSDSQLKPYESWADFALNIKNPASIINFIAAYGTHANITSATTVEEKRDAATAIVLGTEGAPTDRLDFLNAIGDYAGGTLGGLNNVDFWIGGLAEKKMVFGGMLGSTFNFVFEQQLENLQNGDRFYYLSRLANLNLTAQLENNKFSEMIHRNTDATHLPGDAFARPDFFLEVDQTKQFNGDLASADPTSEDPFIGSFSPLVIRDAATNKLHFTGAEHVVLGGTAGNDILIGGLGDDTFWGDEGNDSLEGGEGNDFFFGGDGADVITDKFGDDEVRSGAGDDVVSAGQGINLIITDTGNDFVWAGDDIDELLLGQGDDFGAGGADDDMIIGGEGNDWIESGLDNGLYLGDNGDLIQGLPIKRSVDSPIVGHDILVSTGGNSDFDAETGDDIMVGGLGTDRFFGAFGFDWATYKNDPTGIEADMNNRLFAPPSIAGSPGAILDRYAQTESLSGSRFTDFLRGDDTIDLAGGAIDVTSLGLTVAIPPDHALKDEHVELIEGLDAFLGQINEAGADRFSTGNILLGGAGSDVLEGRGGDDLLDGDRWLDVQIRVNPAPGSSFTQPFLVNGMGEIQARLFSGEIKVSQLEMVRSIKTEGALPNVDVDVAEFSGARADYAVEGIQDLITGEALPTAAGFAADVNGDGFISVAHLTRNAAGAIDVGAIGVDGTDKLKNVERALFSDQTIKLTEHANTIATGAVTLNSSTPNLVVGTVLTADLSGVVDPDGLPVFTSPGAETTRFTVFWQVELAPDSGVYTNIQNVIADEFAPVTGPTFTLTAAETGLNVRALVRFKDDAGAVETLVSTPLGGGGIAGAPVIPDPAIELGLDLAGQVVDGAALPAGTIGILEGSGPFAFTVAQLLTNAVDPNGDIVTLVPNTVAVRTVDGAAAPGVLAFNAGTQTFTFTPAADFFGGVTIEFQITDGTNIVPAEAVLEVIGINDAPVAGTDTGNIGTAAAGATFTFTEAQLIGNATDIDGDQIRLAIPANPPGAPRPPAVTLADPAQGTLVDNGNGTWTFTAAAGAFGPVVLEYAITDRIATIATTATFTMGGTFNGTGAGNTITGTIAGDIINGNGGADTLNGGDGNDTLTGGAGGPDRLNGGAGDDTIVYNAGNGNGANRDIVDGGLGDTDTFVVNGNNTAETFTVFAAADWLALGGGRALLSANSDIVITRGVNTTNNQVIAELDEIEEIVINTGDGNDTVNVVGNFDPTNLDFNTITVENESGEDTVDVTEVESEHRTVLKGNGTISGKRTQDEYQTLAGDPIVNDDSGSDEEEVEDELEDDIEADDDAGSDADDDSDTTSDSGAGAGASSGSGAATGGTGSSTGAASVAGLTLTGTAGVDVLNGGAGDDVISGLAGNDVLLGSSGNNTAIGGEGDDMIVTHGGQDLLMGNDGSDSIFAGEGADTVMGGGGNDRLMGEGGNDLLDGGAGDDMIDAGAGDDLIIASNGDGDDHVEGGSGVDTLDLRAITDNISIYLGGGEEFGFARSGQLGDDNIRSVENVQSGAGNDQITAGFGRNVLSGGLGDDTFIFKSAASANGDLIADFQAGDKIDVSGIGGTFGISHVTKAEGEFTLITDFDGSDQFTIEIAGNHANSVIEDALIKQ